MVGTQRHYGWHASVRQSRVKVQRDILSAGAECQRTDWHSVSRSASNQETGIEPVASSLRSRITVAALYCRHGRFVVVPL
jgi:hypothetical protein